MCLVGTAPSAMADLDTYSVRADLDVPGETVRQWRVFQVWMSCIAVALLLAILFRPTVPVLQRGTQEQERIMGVSKRRNFKIVGLFGLALPTLLTVWLTRRRRRGGSHPRGITIEVTADTNELRIWGRGYGERIDLYGAELKERLVDVYTGRLGAWRQRRILIRPQTIRPGQPVSVELATPAEDGDMDLGFSLQGGEGDCLELRREDFLTLRERLEAARMQQPAQEARPVNEGKAATPGDESAA